MASIAGADFLGLVGPMPSGPGILDLDTAAAIAMATSGLATPILLTSSISAEAIVRDAVRVGVSAVQVVNEISVEEAKALAGSGLHYMQVVHITGPSKTDMIDSHAEYCDAFLLDSGRPEAGELGGTGRVHDWHISRAFCDASPLPVYLAGGLTPLNAAQALAEVRPAGLDICSGLRRDGQLDPTLLNDFMEAIAA